MTYSKVERHLYIEKRLASEGRVNVVILSEVLSVAPETIRRDLAILEKEGRLCRVHGGAVPRQMVQKELAYIRKLEMEYEAKRMIAARAASFVQTGDVIAIDAGTTTVHIADFVRGVDDVTVITNSLPAASRWSDAVEEGRVTGDVIVLGGALHASQRATSGPLTIDGLRPMAIDHAFLSCGGIQGDRVYDYDMNESLVSKQLIEQSNKRWLLADRTKWGRVSFYEIGSLQRMDGLIINGAVPHDWENWTEWVNGGEIE